MPSDFMVVRIYTGLKCNLCGEETQQPEEHLKKEHWDFLFTEFKKKSEPEEVDFELNFSEEKHPRYRSNIQNVN
jgi:hypothetical protein